MHLVPGRRIFNGSWPSIFMARLRRSWHAGAHPKLQDERQHEGTAHALEYKHALVEDVFQDLFDALLLGSALVNIPGHIKHRHIA